METTTTFRFELTFKGVAVTVHTWGTNEEHEDKDVTQNYSL